MASGTGLRAAIALAQMTAGVPVSKEVTWRWEEVYDRTLKIWSLKDGGYASVQGQDWWYNKGQEAVLVNSAMNVLLCSSDAARLESDGVKMQLLLQNETGCLFEREGNKIPVDPPAYEMIEDFEPFSANCYSFAFLLHLFGGPGAEPSNKNEMLDRLAGAYHYPYGGIAVNRSEKAFASFSWRNNVMAMTLPENGMWSFTPTYVNYIGTIVQDRVKEGELYGTAVRTVEHINLDIQEKGFAACSSIKRLSGSLIQDFAFIALPDGVTVYMESLSPLEDCKAEVSDTGILGVRNENLPGLGKAGKGLRELRFDNGRVEGFRGYFEGGDIVKSFDPPEFMSVDDMGFILINSIGVKYCNIHTYKKWRGLEDILVLNSARGVRHFTGGRREPAFMAVVAAKLRPG